MQRIRLLKAVTTCAIAIGLFGCNPAKEIAKAIEVETKEQELTYSITATQNLSDETYEETMGSHTLWNCVTEYCTSMHDPFANGMLRRYTNNQPDQYVNYRKYLCAADLLMDIVNGVKPVTLSMSPESLLTTAAIENFNFTLGSTDSCGENRPQPGATTTISLSDAFQIEFSPLETVNQREDVRRMAYIYYYAAVDQILELAKAQEQLAFLVEEVEDTWFSSTHPTSYLGATLAKQMFASTSTIISQMIDMKTADAEERYHQGITKQDAWFSSEYGRVPAIAHLAGAINIDDRYIASPDGTTYWTRCRVGQTWNGSTCEGSHSTFKWDEAADACDSDKGERLPTLDEYFEILNDSVVFCAPSGTSGTCSCTNCTGDNGVCGASSICSAMFGNDKQHYFTELHGTDWRVAMDLDDQGWSRKYEHHADRPVRCVVSVHDLWSRPHMDLLPNNNAPLPKMTNSLAGAVSLLNNNKINFPCFAREIPGEVDPYDSCTQEELENILRTRVNDRLVSLDQAPLSSTDIWSKKGTTEGDLVQAAKYMYSHLILYPRETNYTEASDEHFDPEFEFEGWKNSFVSLPTQYRVRDIDKTWLESYPLESPMDMNDMVAYVGLMPLLQSLRYSILDSTEALSDIPDAGVADGDKYVGFLDDTMDYIRAQTGKSYVHYKWDNSTDLTVYYHHPVILSEPPDTVATHLRIYPIGDVESPNQFDNFVCMQLDPNCDVAYHDIALNSCDMSPEPDGGTDWEPREPYCVGELTGLDDSVVQWMVEMNQSESSDIGQWKPIGVLRAESEGAQGDLSFSGNIMGMLSIFTGFNSDSLNSEPCVSIGGIDRPCVPRNWVPAIDNELIDPSGNQYEESYRHYLGLARSAASKAKSLREDLINDVIQREHEEGMQAAKLEEALHAYSSEVQNICGDKFQKEAFDIKVREIYVDQGSSESFADRVKSEYPYFVDYGCLYENGDPYEGHERVKNSRPLHCSVDRRCSPVELWELGVFSEVGRHAPSYDGSADWNEQPSFEPEPEELFIPIMDEQTVLETIGLTATGVGPGSKSGPGQTFGHPSEQFTNPATSAQAVEFGNQLLSAAKQGGLFNLQSMEMLPMDRERFPYNDVPNFPENARTWNTKCSDYDFSVTTMPEWPDCTMYQGTMYDCVIEALWQMRCWAENHRTFAQTFIEKHKVRAIPKIFDMSGQNLYEIQLERELANLGNNYGRYYDALHDIASAITEMKSAAASYIYEVDNAIMNIDAIKNAINLAKNEKDLMIAMQLANAQTAGVMYEHQFRATAELCIDGKTNAKNPNGVAHVDAIEGALLSMENELGSQENWNTWWGSMQENVLKANIDKEYFVNYCINTKTITDPTFNSFKNIICGYVGDTYWGKQSWHRTGAFYPSNDGPIDGELAFYTHFEKKGQNYLTEICPISNHFFENTYCPCRRNGDDGVVFKALCLDHKEDANAKCISGFNWVDDICRNDGGYGLSVSGISKTEIATEIQKLIMKKLYSECDIGDYSCDITIPEMKTVVEEATVGNCTGIGANASTELDQNIEDWEEDGDMWKLAQSGSIFQQKSGADDLVSTMIQVGHNLATQKARLAIAIRDLSVKSAKLNLLETEQDNLFQKAVNDKNSAEAASYANLAEWQERYNFKVDEYHDQLKRARYSAWVARRAIEFRLGIDLSMEVTETPYGDKPSDWADEIYTTYTSTCGLQEIDGNEVEIAEGDSNITACLSQENLIEKYVQKLDDYVEAYGNSGWWFHEDDDTGVISIRDNVAVTNVDCTTQVYNLLNFTEEIGLTGDERDTVYNGYYDDVSAWTRSPEITLTENREDMGIPFDIMASHFTNEYGVFEDQMEQNTGDVLKASPGVEVEISQEVDIEFAQDAGQSENYEFSMYLRKNPESRDCDEGEEYFAEIGKCGVPCELQIEDDQVVDMYGDCNESDTPEGSKQVCMYAGVGPTEEGVYARRRMCNWCTADRGCIFQDGEVVTLSIEDEITVNRNVSQVNATAYSFWNRQHVNNVDYLIYTGPPPPLPDDGDGDGDGDGADDSEGNTPTISVHLKNTVTKNLINSSERVDTEMGWIMGPGTSVNGRVPSPDGAEHGAYELSYPSSFSIETQEEIEDVSYHTGSIWMKVPGGTSSDDEGGGVVTITLAKENGDLISENLGVSLDTQWKRYEIHGKTEFITTKLVMSITQETYFEKIHVWGAQIEKGIGTTTYIPTGKNILPESKDWKKWECQYPAPGCSIELSDETGPAGPGGVYKLSDGATTVHSGILFNSIYGNFEADEDYTFSIWTKSGDGESHPRVYIFISEYVDDTYLGSTQMTIQDMEGDGDWKRYERTYHTVGNNGNPPNRFKIAIYPDWDVSKTGSILVWGPQLEKGEYATGYQETWWKNLIANSMDLTTWTSQGGITAALVDNPGPGGVTGNVNMLSDISASWASKHDKIYEDYTVGDSYTFSVWLSSGDEDTHCSKINFYQFNEDGSECYRALPLEPNPPVGSWQLYERTFQIADCDSTNNAPPAYLKVYIDPEGACLPEDTGSILVWGPQLEKGTTRTEYQPTGAPPNILPDGDMEDTTACDANGCGVWSRGSSATLNKVTSDRDGSSQAIRIEYNNVDDPYVYQNILTVDKKYRLSGWARGDGTAGSHYPKVYLVGKGNLWTGTNSNEWQKIEVVFEATHELLMIQCSASSAGYAEYDDLRLVDINDNPTYIASYEKDWGLDVAVVGAQLVPVETFQCDDSGRPVYRASECIEWYKDARPECCARVDDWEVSYNVNKTFGDFYKVCTDCTGEGDCIARGGEPAWRCHEDYHCADEFVDENPSECAYTSTDYQRNTYLQEHFNPICTVEKAVDVAYPDIEHLEAYPSKEVRKQIFKAGFDYVPGKDTKPGFHAYQFTIDMDSIEDGAMGQFGILAEGNFNYRVRTVALNVVGVDVIDCSKSETPETCDVNQWLSYDLVQSGDVRIKNHHGEYSVRPFDIPSGKIAGAKAWVSEQVVGFPISGAHQGSLAQIQKTALMGRPLQGTFEIRIYETPELNWDNVEDIQLILGYHYWTRSE